MVVKAGEVDVVASTANQIGEGPVWLPDQQRLLWVDITGRRLLWFDPGNGRVETLDVGRDVGAVVPTESGKLMAAVVDGFPRSIPRRAAPGWWRPSSGTSPPTA